MSLPYRMLFYPEKRHNSGATSILGSGVVCTSGKSIPGDRPIFRFRMWWLVVTFLIVVAEDICNIGRKPRTGGYSISQRYMVRLRRRCSTHFSKLDQSLALNRHEIALLEQVVPSSNFQRRVCPSKESQPLDHGLVVQQDETVRGTDRIAVAAFVGSIGLDIPKVQ